MIHLLRANARVARAPGTRDSTVYGAARTSPREYYAHHSAAISAAIVFADARVLLSHAEYLSRQASARPRPGARP